MHCSKGVLCLEKRTNNVTLARGDQNAVIHGGWQPDAANQHKHMTASAELDPSNGKLSLVAFITAAKLYRDVTQYNAKKDRFCVVFAPPST